MANIVLAHGAWSAAWAWKKMRPLFAAAGHTFYSPSYTGLGERAHLARPDIDLSTHIQDVLNVLEFEDLKDVVLLGHSYGGMVALTFAAKYPARVERLLADGRPVFVLPFVSGLVLVGTTDLPFEADPTTARADDAEQFAQRRHVGLLGIAISLGAGLFHIRCAPQRYAVVLIKGYE